MKPLSMVLLLLGIVGTLAFTIFMPAAELMTAQINPAPRENGESPLRSEEIMKVFGELANNGIKMLGFPTDADYKSSIESRLSNPAGDGEATVQGANFPYYVYSVFLGLAMLAGAIAIQAVGREDSEEKTILPIKK